MSFGSTASPRRGVKAVWSELCQRVRAQGTPALRFFA